MLKKRSYIVTSRHENCRKLRPTEIVIEQNYFYFFIYLSIPKFEDFEIGNELSITFRIAIFYDISTNDALAKDISSNDVLDKVGLLKLTMAYSISISDIW
jgi:hypothetical protein